MADDAAAPPTGRPWGAPPALPAASPSPIPHHYQETEYTCGPAALRMVLEAIQGVRHEEEDLARALGSNDFIGTRQRVLLTFARRRGLEAQERHSDTQAAEIGRFLADGFAVIVCYFLEGEAVDHYAVVTAAGARGITLHDPWLGPDTGMVWDAFEAHWHSDPRIATRRDRWLMAVRAPPPADVPVGAAAEAADGEAQGAAVEAQAGRLQADMRRFMRKKEGLYAQRHVVGLRIWTSTSAPTG